MLQDLVFAFEACDVDGTGYLDANELLVVMRVLGGVDPTSGGNVSTLDLAAIEAVIADEKIAWQQYKKESSRAAQLMNINAKLMDNVATRAAKSGLTSGLSKVHAGGLVKGASKLKSGVGKASKVALSAASDVAHSAAHVVADVAHIDAAKDKDADFDDSDSMSYPMFVHLLTSGRVNDILGTDHDDWEDQVHQMRLMKHAWEAVDLDGNGALTADEMRKTSRELLGHMTEVEYSRLWKILQPDASSTEISYLEFLDGMATAAVDKDFQSKFESLNPTQLRTVLLDVPVMAKEEKMMMKTLSGAERMCVKLLAKTAMKLEAGQGSVITDIYDSDDVILARLAEGSVHLLTNKQRTNVGREHFKMVCWGGLFGFLSATATAFSETIAMLIFDCNGVKNPDTDEVCTQDQIMGFGIIVISAIAICSILGPGPPGAVKHPSCFPM